MYKNLIFSKNYLIDEIWNSWNKPLLLVLLGYSFCNSRINQISSKVIKGGN